MAISVGHRGYIKLIPVEEGAHRTAKLISFQARGTAGDIEHPQFSPDMQPVWVGNMSQGGADKTAFFTDTGSETGTLKQNDTGTNQNNVGSAGDTMWALYTDTGI